LLGIISISELGIHTLKNTIISEESNRKISTNDRRIRTDNESLKKGIDRIVDDTDCELPIVLVQLTISYL